MSFLRSPRAALLAFLLTGCASVAPPALPAAQPDPVRVLPEGAPLFLAGVRPTALRFGMYVTADPEHNPIDPPERFTGYHTGLDFELLPEEARADVPVFAICNGAILYSGFTKGYGGLVVQRCEVTGERVTVLYGHLDTRDAPPEDSIATTGLQIGTLAPSYSEQSDGNRKHLHLGIRRGETSDFRGYVQIPDEIRLFVDPATVLPPGAAGRPVDRYVVRQEPLSQP